MKAEEKAKELIERFNDVDGTDYDCQYLSDDMSKQCALICVDEIIKEGYDNNMYQGRINYWQKVKQEIEKL